MIEGVDEILQIFMHSQLPPKVRIKSESIPHLQKVEQKIERLKGKYVKMDREYKRLHGIFMNSEHRKKEKDLLTNLKVQEAELYNLREHYNAMLRYNEQNQVSLYRSHQVAGRLQNQLDSLASQIRQFKRKHNELNRIVREEEFTLKTNHQHMTDLLTA